MFPFWDDLYMNSGTIQSAYYASTGTAPNRQLVFEYYTNRCCSFSATAVYRFRCIFYENTPNVVSFVYYQAPDGGNSATIGVQRKLLPK